MICLQTCCKITLFNVQVKLLKCLVDNILVDISFDTLGGLCTVAFLESIDRHIGKHHLFKRSVILVLPCPMPLHARPSMGEHLSEFLPSCTVNQ